MTYYPNRNYHCKDEELPVICEYASFSLKRDLSDFKSYSPKFNESYVTGFDAKIAIASELVNPRTETAELKAITLQLYTTMDGIIEPANRLEGYIKLAKNKLPVSVADFGIPVLRKKIYAKDAEGVIHNLRLVISNIEKYKEALTAEGLTEALTQQLENAIVSVNADNDKQYEILSGRKELVQSNLVIFNDLYGQLSEICDVGKILYKRNNPDKLQEYTFSYLLKKVRVVHKKQQPSLEEQ
jgi:hypothetical protein